MSEMDAATALWICSTLSRPRPVSSAVPRVLPTSALGVSVPWSASVVAGRSTLLPPAVLMVMTPAETSAGTTRVMSCWSVPVLSASTTVRRLKLPTPRPSMVMARSLVLRPVPSSTMVLPAATVPPTARSTGTICSVRLVALPSTVRLPVRASAGTTTLSVVPLLPAVPVTVRVPVAPLSSMPWNCTSVLLVKPWPVRTMVWPVLAEACAGLPAAPSAAVAVMAVKVLTGCGAKRASICA